MDFYSVVKESEEDKGYTYNPFAGKVNDEWVGGYTSIDFLNNKYGHCNTVKELIDTSESEGFKLYFEWLKEKGILH